MNTPRSYSPKAIRPDMTVRQFAVDFPSSREVFRGYGEPSDRPGQFPAFESSRQSDVAKAFRLQGHQDLKLFRKWLI